MFGIFNKGIGTSKATLPRLDALVIVYEPPVDATITGAGAVTKLTSSAPNFTGRFISTYQTTTSGQYVSNSIDQDEMFGKTFRPRWRLGNASNQHFDMTESITDGVTPDGFTVFVMARRNVPGTTFGWSLDPVGSGDTIDMFWTHWNSAGIQRPRFKITTTTGADFQDDQFGFSNGKDFRRFHCFATDFTGGATGAEYYLTQGLPAATGGTMALFGSATGPNDPASDYTYIIGQNSNNRPSVDFQGIYVWKTKLTSNEISQVEDYINNVYIPTL